MVYNLIKLLAALLKSLPLNLALLLGRVVGVFLWCVPGKRVVGFRNLKLVFPDKGTREIFSILRRSCINFGMSLVETFVAERIVGEGRIEFSSGADIDEGAVLVGIHEGSWEVFNAAFARRYHIAILARRQRVAGFDRFLNEERERQGIRVFFSLKSLLDFLKKNRDYHAGIVIDQGHEKKAPLVDFFGCPVPTPRGSVYLARKLNRRIYPFFGYRRNGKLYLSAVAPLNCTDREDIDALESLHRVYEGLLRRYPQEYVWWYKRFKRKRKLRILILSDGKAGHLKQSLALLHFFKELDYRIEEDVVEVKIKNRLVRLLLEVSAFFSLRSEVGYLGPLKFVLKREVYRKISCSFYDIVVSTGSSVAPVNVFVAHFMGARAVTIMKPNLPLSRFDLAFIPEHDRTVADNAVNIKGALSYPYNFEKHKKEFAAKFKLSGRRKASLFIGGALDNEDIFRRNLSAFIHPFKEFVTKHNFSVLITTSRRTPSCIDEMMEREFSSFSATEVLIIANKENFPFVADGFLAYSHIVFVSTDSISMISESLGMQKTTVGVELERLLDTHHINFFMSVKELVNFLEPPYRFYNFHAPSYSLFSYNRDIVKEAIKRVL